MPTDKQLAAVGVDIAALKALCEASSMRSRPAVSANVTLAIITRVEALEAALSAGKDWLRWWGDYYRSAEERELIEALRVCYPDVEVKPNGLPGSVVVQLLDISDAHKLADAAERDLAAIETAARAVVTEKDAIWPLHDERLATAIEALRSLLPDEDAVAIPDAPVPMDTVTLPLKTVRSLVFDSAYLANGEYVCPVCRHAHFHPGNIVHGKECAVAVAIAAIAAGEVKEQ